MATDFRPHRIHFIGICGVSMSALAKLALIRGNLVSGSDAVFGEEMLVLCDAGIHAYAGHDPSVAAAADLVVYTGAVNDNDPELKAARENLVPTVERSHYLQEVTKGYQSVIAVAGTHGKTTTTAMLASIFLQTDLPFTAHIGGYMQGYGNLVYKGDRFFITEACEFRRSFLAIKPDYSVITNVELDHPDTYKDTDELYQAFAQFAQNTKYTCVTESGGFYEYLSQKGIRAVAAGAGGCYRAANISEYKNGHYAFDVLKQGTYLARITLSVAGAHNIYNAVEAFGVADAAGIDPCAIQRGLCAFEGIARRFQKIAERQVTVYSDYAHHPSEIRAAIRTAKSLQPKRLVVAFQPHTYSRTRALFEDFLTAFEGADRLYIFKTYSARETEADGTSGYALYEKLQDTYDGTISYYENMVSLAASVLSNEQEGDLTLVLGAGDINTLCDLIRSP